MQLGFITSFLNFFGVATLKIAIKYGLLLYDPYLY